MGSPDVRVEILVFVVEESLGYLGVQEETLGVVVVVRLRARALASPSSLLAPLGCLLLPLRFSFLIFRRLPQVYVPRVWAY